MSFTINGNDIEFTGTVRVVNGFNPETGVAYLILTPDGGVGSLPFLAQGLPGKPPVFDSITVEEVPPGELLPAPNPVVTTVSAGGSGVESHLALKFYIHRGATGPIGTNVISTASDLATTPALGGSTNGYTLVYRSSDGKWVPTPSPASVQDTYASPAILATPNNNASPRTLSEISVPAMPFAWRPRVFATTQINGGVLTRIDLFARLNDPASGDQVGYSKGIQGALPPPSILVPAYPAGAAVPGSYGRVPAGQAATVYLVAEQKAATNTHWSTPASPDTTFNLEVQALV